MNWRYKALLQTVLSGLPAGHDLNYLFRRYVTKTVPASRSVTALDYSFGAQHLAALRASGSAVVEHALFYEFGAGWDLTIPLSLYSLGVNHQIVTDLWPLLKSSLIARTTALLPMLALDPAPLRLPSPFPASAVKADLGPLLRDLYGIDYRAPFDARTTGLAQDSIDYITSSKVLPFIPVAVVRDIIGECLRILRPGGCISLLMDYRDNFSYFDTSLSVYNFLRYSEQTWNRRYNPSLSYQNRLRHGDYRRLLDDAGFEIVTDEPGYDGPIERAREILRTIPLAEQFRDYDRDDLAAVRGVFVLRKPIAAIGMDTLTRPQGSHSGLSKEGLDDIRCSVVARRLYAMRILFVLVSLPFPANIGQRVRNYTLLRSLRMEGHQVVLVAFGETAELSAARRGLGDLCLDAEVVSPNRCSNDFIGRMQALVSQWPYGAWRLRSELMRQAVAKELCRRDFDLVLCDDVYQMANLPVQSAVPVILNKHTIVHEEVQRFLDHQHNPLVSIYGRVECRRLKRLESQSCRRVARVWTCSERDREILHATSPGGEFSVVPNVIDVDDYRPADTDDGRTVLFVGAMDWLPNRDAVEFFVLRVLPELRCLAPDVSFVVAGREPPLAFRNRFERFPNVTFTGTVPDLRPLIGQAAVCTVPLRIGSGTRIKILEASAMAKAIVSTTIGAEGLCLANGREIILADQPRQIARSIAELLGNPNRRRDLGRAARSRIVASYSIPALREALREGLTFGAEQPIPRPAPSLRGYTGEHLAASKH